MYCSSSQLANWTFSSETDIWKARIAVNNNYLKQKGVLREVSHNYLTPAEEYKLVKHYEQSMFRFCSNFHPQLPKAVVGTSFHYFKRFYLQKSVMEHHPKGILVTCVFFACKVEEFNISLHQFVANVKGDREKACEIILNSEMILMHTMNYNLTIHNPYRSIEGLLIDIKTCANIPNPECLRKDIDDFMERVLLTDLPMLYSPAQISLAAVMHAVRKAGLNLDNYVMNCLCKGSTDTELQQLVETVRKMRASVKHVEPFCKDEIKHLELKLDKCQESPDNHKKRDHSEDDSESHMIKRISSNLVTFPI